MEHIQEQYEDAALTLLVNHIMQKEGDQFLAKNEALHEEHGSDYPADLDIRISGTIDRHFTSLRRRRAFAAFNKTVTRVSTVFLIVFLIFSLTFTNVSAFRDAALSFTMKTFGYSSAIIGQEYSIIDSTSSPMPRWMPTGDWEIAFYASDTNTTKTKYVRSDGSYINIIKYTNSSSILSVDIEKAELDRDTLINGNPSVISIKDDSIILTWVDESDDSLFEITVCGSSELVNTAVIVRIAESLA